MKRWIMVLPLAVFLLVAVFLYRGLFLDPSELPSAMIGKPFPAFALQSVDGKPLTEADLLGKPALVNVWATWCPSCKVEHPYLNKLAEQGVVIHGVNYKDDNAAALKWLAEFHNPYQLDIRDEQGSLGLDLGVYGAPETFLIDAKGIIRYKHVGVVDASVWREQLAPQYQSLVDEAKP
ncbi:MULTISPECIES: DsbE family thiol:disulfide interchange protein [Pseudomonas]|uniref:DsbE family thiol:disulfide interchange protein n=1 Tax=Pseudomonas donghuensis TaxID=1163398 RepID=A0AAP0SLT2_9PSED|nr:MULTISPECIES: DsbE family thiol:disulfide interchange protein [Pseudomonas]MDF9892488.1 cytochrome c biogenesis protein CcmG/thiol:disulfide interchange protein DsbE [Pseudomonas vranovensis]KDO01050.1 DsbE family thiol:disulfide interchange protein [Pseudomonas donghuensis]MBF4207618.1 DsbE family thiol:disulfide interchange protein [Pseudomonas donghuensis]MBS7600138.1 DsbE family thiol:disulfide interchange protein [Pseudomonas sp. RC2C2]MCP3751045.1 DsbE family thiol:disulfide interchan